jgi:hypothetical protein
VTEASVVLLEGHCRSAWAAVLLCSSLIQGYEEQAVSWSTSIPVNYDDLLLSLQKNLKDQVQSYKSALQFCLSGVLLSVAEEWEKLACLANGYPQAQLDSLLTLLISHAEQVHLALESVMHTASERMGHAAVSGHSAHALGDLGGLCPGSQPFSYENPEPAGCHGAAVFLQNSATQICCS